MLDFLDPRFLLHLLATGVRNLLGWIVGRRPEAPDLNREGWYWTPHWQRAEAEADKDLAEGQYADVRSVPTLHALLAREQPDVLFEALRTRRP